MSSLKPVASLYRPGQSASTIDRKIVALQNWSSSFSRSSLVKFTHCTAMHEGLTEVLKDFMMSCERFTSLFMPCTLLVEQNKGANHTEQHTKRKPS